MNAVVGKQYRHYKNKKLYVVLHLGWDTETGEEVVAYEGQYNDPDFGHKPVWVRPRKMFEEQIMCEGKLVDRFEAV